MNEIYVLDTNVILADSQAFLKLHGNDVVIPSVVLQEIDSKKNRADATGHNARDFIRCMDKLRDTGSLHTGVLLRNGGMLYILTPPDECAVYQAFNDSDNDNAIIAVAYALNEFAVNKKVVLLSNDINVRVKAGSFGIKSEQYKNDCALAVDENYTGIQEIELCDDVLFELAYNGKTIKHFVDCPENQFAILKKDSRQVMAIRKGDALKPLYNHIKHDFAWGIKAKNDEQKAAFELLFDPKIPVVTLEGKAGTGKTLLALAAALQQTVGEKTYQKILVARPIVPLGRDMGFLPGELADKLQPWIQPIYDNQGRL